MIPINYGVLKPITLCCGCRLAHVHANLLQFNRSVMIDCLRPHGLQHAWPPCPSSISRIYPNSCPIMEKAMATHSSTLAWKIPWTEEPGGLQSMGVSKSRTQLSDFTFTFHFHALEKEMATHSSVLAWRIPGTAEPGGLLSMGSHRVGHD